MNNSEANIYDADSGFYNLPLKQSWKCNRVSYLVISTTISIAFGLIAAFVFAPWLFGSPGQLLSSMTMGGTYFALFSLFAPFVLFASCVMGNIRFNRKLFAYRTYEQYDLRDVLKVIQAILRSFLKTALVYFVIAVLSSPVIVLIAFVVAAISIVRIFK